jgi:hypothetical protein
MLAAARGNIPLKPDMLAGKKRGEMKNHALFGVTKGGY